MMATSAEPMVAGDQAPLCYCFNITKHDVRWHFSKPGATLEQLIQQTQVTTRCTACALDVDVFLDELQAGTTRVSGSRVGSAGPAVQQDQGSVWIRADSGFFIEENGISTTLCLANFDPMFGQRTGLVADHFCRLWLFDENGSVRSHHKLRLEANSEVAVHLGDLENCPARGWLIVSQYPEQGGMWGTLRPQLLLKGASWTCSYHTQFHADATKSGRRAAVGVKVIEGRSHALLPIINGSSKSTTYSINLTDAMSGQAASRSGTLQVRGAAFLDLDELFSGWMPREGFLNIEVGSEEPTRKFVVIRHPKRGVSINHFPN